jgi:thioesterase domain-containing protein/acyl carrier protein
MLQGIVADASRRLSELPLLTDEERYHLLVEWSCAEHALPSLPDASSGNRVYILDRQLQPVPVGVPGELFVGAGAVDEGTLADEGWSPDRLVPDPFSCAGAMLLRTGERACWRADGTLSLLEGKCAPSRVATPDANLPPAHPLSTVEQQLREIWEEILGIGPIGVNENFFELGGHSLMAVRLFSAIERCLDRHLPLATLLQAPTIAQLARVLDAADAADTETASSSGGMSVSDRWSSLVPISATGSRPPLICVHGSGGNILGYRRLAQRLGPEQPVYGLQARGLDGVTAPVTRIEEMAANYVAELQSAWPDGPYALCGLSFGGTVAFEMARLLRQQGQAVALVALFDSCPEHMDWLTAGENIYSRLTRLTSMLRCHLGNIRSLPVRGVPRYVRAQLRTQRHMIRGFVWRHRYRRYQKAPGENRSLPVELQNVEQACEMAFRGYRPRPYSGRVTLFRAAIRSAGEGDDPLFGWGHLAAGGVDVHDVPGSHVTMLNEPHVDRLAEKLSACLAAAFAPDHASPL